MMVKTDKMTDLVLDWAVAMSQKKIDNGPYEGFHIIDGKLHLEYCGATLSSAYDPSTDWSIGGAILELLVKGPEFTMENDGDNVHVSYSPHENSIFYGYGPSVLIAVMRCYVALSLGEEVDVPDELLLAA